MKVKVGDCLQYEAYSGGMYRVVVSAICGDALFCHAVFTNGVMQKTSPLHALDIRFLRKLKKVKLGKRWRQEGDKQ